jgi:biotin carboxyl carrier protein
MTFDVVIEGRSYKLDLTRGEQNEWRATLRGEGMEPQELTVNATSPEPNVLSIVIGGKSYEVRRDVAPTGDFIEVNGIRQSFELRDPRSLRSRRGKGDLASGPAKITAPMPGKIVRIVASEGTEVEAGQGVVVIEAMKMQNELKAPKKGVVKKISAAEGAAVNAGDTLAIVE